VQNRDSKILIVELITKAVELNIKSLPEQENTFSKKSVHCSQELTALFM
jgi:hypothetical protein